MHASPRHAAPPCAVLALLLAAPGPAARAAGAAPAAPPTGLAAFTRQAQVVDASLSPGGRYLAAVVLDGGKRALRVVDLQNGKSAGTFRSEGRRGVGEIHWASEGKLALELVEHDGDLAAPRSYGEILAMGVDGGNARLIFGYRAGEMQTGSHIKKGGSDLAWGYVIDRIRGDKPGVLVQASSFSEVGDSRDALYRVNAVSGVKELLLRGPVPGVDFLTDEDGLPRIAWGVDAQARQVHFYREASGGWEPLSELGGVQAGDQPLGFWSKGRTLYASARDGDGFAVLAISLATGERKVLARDPLVPPSHLAFDAAHRLVAVEFMPDLPLLQVVEPALPLGRALVALRRAYPDERLRLVDQSDDDARLLVEVSSDRDPGRFLLVDTGTMKAEEVGEARPWIDPEEMAEATPFHLAARDGLQIHGYLTQPQAPAGRPPPLVVIPHGGPHGIRFRWGFDPEAQLLASKGFAVLQVNYRGSGGYGEAFQKAGYQHWGDQVIEDVVDATRHALAKGWGDPERVCIYGGSFGGYAALQAASLEPALFRCAVGYAGVYDLERLPDREEVAASRLSRGWFGTVAGGDAEALRRASPARHAGRITARVLLVHGEEDPRAPLDQAERMRKALADAGRPPEWLVEPHEGHGFYDEGARERFYGRLVQFLQGATRQEGAPGGAAPR